MTRPSTRLINLLKNLLRQHLAQLNAPLIEAVDIPHRTLRKRQMLVVNNQGAQFSGSNVSTDEDACRGPVAQEYLVGNQVLGHAAFGTDLIGCLAYHERLGLGEVVAGEHLLVEVIRDGVVALGGKDEIGRDQLGALVDELEEGVLGVGAWLAEEDGAGGVLGRGAVRCDGLAVGLHGELLEVGREAVEVLVEGGDKVGLCAEEVGVPHAEETSEGGDVLVEGS